jgi:hypothetical protein
MRMRKSPSQAAHQTPGMEQQFWAVVESQMIPVIYSHQEIYRQLMLLKWRKGLVKALTIWIIQRMQLLEVAHQLEVAQQ